MRRGEGGTPGDKLIGVNVTGGEFGLEFGGRSGRVGTEVVERAWGKRGGGRKRAASAPLYSLFSGSEAIRAARAVRLVRVDGESGIADECARARSRGASTPRALIASPLRMCSTDSRTSVCYQVLCGLLGRRNNGA